MTKFYAYIWSDPKDGLPRYVGKGISTRPMVHLQESSTTNLSRMLRKRFREGYSADPLMIPANSEEHAFWLEKMLIAAIGRLDKGLGPLFNKTDGGDGPSGIVFSKESRKKNSESNKKAWTEPGRREAKSKQMLEHFKKPGSREKASTASASRFKDPEFLAAHKAARGKVCTIDDVTTYPSRKALVAALGHGPQGAGSPNFKYLSGPSYARRSRNKTQGL